MVNGSQNVIVVDCKKSYNEINKGSYSPGNHTFNFSYSSDWVIAVGNFDNPHKYR